MGTQLTGLQYYALATTKLNNFAMDKTLFYIYLNTARINREMARAWMVLRKQQSSQIASPGNTYQTPYIVPTDFVRLQREGVILLWNAASNTWQECYEIPYNLLIQYKDNNLKFAIDHSTGNLYISGIIDRQYNVVIDYQADLGDILDNTVWQNIPSRFDPILVFDVVAMYQLGDDYDDIQARNANENVQAASRLFNAMVEWDNSLQLSSVTTMDRPSIGDLTSGGGDFVNKKINMGY